MDKSFIFSEIWVDHISTMTTMEKGQFLEKILETENLYRGYSPSIDNTEIKIIDKRNPNINNFIKLLKDKCKELKIPYQSKKDRMFAKHILSAREFGEFADNINITREELAINIMIASIKIGYWKGVCSGPMSIYQNYTEIYNQTISIRQKQQIKPKKTNSFIC